MPRSILKIAAVAALIGCSAGSAQAADMAAPKVMPPEAKAPDPIIGFAFYSQLASDYNLRGVSQSDRQYSYQSFFEAQFFNNLAYAGFYT
ncbi:hypothetical protein ABS774_05250, partial [Methylobacterium oxalidis]